MKNLLYLFLLLVTFGVIPQTSVSCALKTTDDSAKTTEDSANSDSAKNAESDLAFQVTYDNVKKWDNDTLDEPITGDFDGDGKTDTARILWHAIYDTKVDTLITCDTFSYICFSKKSIPSIKVDKCMSGFLQNLGDLNGDKCDEIGIYCGYRQHSNWSGYKTYTYKGGTWKLLIDNLFLPASLWDDNSHLKPVQKYNSKKVKVTYLNPDWQVLNKKVRMKN